MADIRPFRGIRYNSSMIPDVSEVLSPPYDVIDEELQTSLYQRSPFNVVRLEFGQTFPGDDENQNRYIRAAETYMDWLNKGVLIQDVEPSLYVYRQYFTYQGMRKTRTAIIASLKVVDYDRGEVYPHEATLPKPKEDRLKLLRACNANFSPIFGLYLDPGLEIDQLLATAIGEEPLVTAKEDAEVDSALWRIRDPEAISAISARFALLPIFIADGHHRYDTALTYSREKSSKELVGFDRIMVALVNMYDEGLVLLPTHRVVRGLPESSLSSFEGRVQPLFQTQVLGFIEPTADSVQALLDQLRLAGEKSTSFVVFRRDAPAVLVSLRAGTNSELDSLLPSGRSPGWRSLDVTILHHVLLRVGLATDGTEEGGKLEFGYTQKALEACSLVERRDYQMAILLNATKPTSVIEVAKAGDKMPQKSTYFWPKLATGFVIHPLPCR